MWCGRRVVKAHGIALQRPRSCIGKLKRQSLLTKLDYVLSGVIHNLDEGDPEIVYFKAASMK